MKKSDNSATKYPIIDLKPVFNFESLLDKRVGEKLDKEAYIISLDDKFEG